MDTNNEGLRLRAAVIPPLAEAEGSPDRIYMDLIPTHSDYPNIEARLHAQEAMFIIFHAHLQKIQQNKTDSISLADLRAKIQTFDGTVGFQHIRGILAEMKVDVAEIKSMLTTLLESKDMLATLVAKLG